MSGMWNRTLVYLGLREEPEDVYDEPPEQFVPEDDPHAEHAPPRAYERRPAPGRYEASVASARPAPGEARAARLARSNGEADDESNVRALHGGEGRQRTVTTRTAVVSLAVFDDVEAVGARFRTGQPVVLDVSSADAPTARRVVDFVSGLTYALRGRVAKVGARAFLLTPEGVALSEEERLRLADLGYRVAAGGDA